MVITLPAVVRITAVEAHRVFVETPVGVKPITHHALGEQVREVGLHAVNLPIWFVESFGIEL